MDGRCQMFLTKTKDNQIHKGNSARVQRFGKMMDLCHWEFQAILGTFQVELALYRVTTLGTFSYYFSLSMAPAAQFPTCFSPPGLCEDAWPQSLIRFASTDTWLRQRRWSWLVLGKSNKCITEIREDRTSDDSWTVKFVKVMKLIRITGTWMVSSLRIMGFSCWYSNYWRQCQYELVILEYIVVNKIW